MGFFSDLHRTIFDPDYHREAAGRPRGRVVMFMLKLLVFSALIMCASKTYYLLHSERGIAPLVSAMFGDLAISDGRLVAEREQPYGVPGDMLTELMNRLVGHPRFFDRVPDNFLVVDTRTPPAAYEDAAAAPKVVLKESGIDFREMRVEMPYGAIVGGADFRFTAQAVQGALNRNAAAFALNFLMSSLFFGFFTMALSVLFLSLAAYVFRADRRSGYPHFLRLACFSISPVMLGNALVAVTGVSAEWTWHVFIILSTVLMFRAMVRATPGKTPEEKREAM